MVQELNDLRKDSLLIPSQAECTKEETRILNEKVMTERNNVLKLYFDIQQCNAKITNITVSFISFYLFKERKRDFANFT